MAPSADSSSSSSSSGPVKVRVIPQQRLHVSTPTWWLESRFHFSFAEYWNPSNSNFGVLRVLNDDLVQPHSGFGRHPHRNMEIVTYVVDGALTHKDSMGTEETLGRGCVQYMSAGTGVTHSEMNNSDKLLRFLQIWILPDANGLKPNYGSRRFSKAERHNRLQQVVTSFRRYGSDHDAGTGVIPIHQDVAMYAAELDPGVRVSLRLRAKRQAYAVCIEGAVAVDGSAQLQARDAVEMVGPTAGEHPVAFEADSNKGAHIFVIEMAAE